MKIENKSTPKLFSFLPATIKKVLNALKNKNFPQFWRMVSLHLFINRWPTKPFEIQAHYNNEQFVKNIWKTKQSIPIIR